MSGFAIKKQDDGSLVVPFVAESEDGIKGDGTLTFPVDHPEYDKWLAEWELEQELVVERHGKHESEEEKPQ